MNVENLIDFRKSIGLRQEDFAKIIGVKQSTYSCYETERRIIPILKLNIIAMKYHRSLNYLSENTGYDNIEFVDKNFTLKEVGIILRKERKERNMTQKQVAQQLNIDKTCIVDYEKGRGLTIPILIQYSELFDKSIDYLCGKAKK